MLLTAYVDPPGEESCCGIVVKLEIYGDCAALPAHVLTASWYDMEMSGFHFRPALDSSIP